MNHTPLQIAILGTGGMGRTVLSHLKDFDLVSKVHLYDVDPERPRALAEKEPKAVASSLQAIMADPAIKLVYITAANSAHYDLAMESMRHGKAVLCEKPMANTMEDCRRMLDYARENKCFLQIGFELRYSKLYLQVKQWIDAGLLGRVLSVQCAYVCSEFVHKGSWRTKTATNGSMFGEKLSHYVDLCRWYTGCEVEEVYSACAPNAVPYFEVHDNYQTTLKFQGGAVAHIGFTMNLASSFEGDPLQDILAQQQDDGHELRYLIVGEKGAVETDVFRRRIKRWEFTDTPEKLRSTWVEDLNWKPEEDHTYIHNTTDQTHDIARRVAEGRPPYTPATDSFESMRLCDAVERSSDTRQSVSMNEAAPAPASAR